MIKLKVREWAFRCCWYTASGLSHLNGWIWAHMWTWFPEYMNFADSDEEVEIWDDADYEEDEADQRDAWGEYNAVAQPDLFEGWEENELQHLLLKDHMDRLIEGKDDPDAQERTHIPM